MPFRLGERTHKLPSNFIYLKIWDPASARRRGLIYAVAVYLTNTLAADLAAYKRRLSFL